MSRTLGGLGAAVVLISLSLGCGGSDEPAPSEELPGLTIGSAAPAIEIEHWLQGSRERFGPTSGFEPGRVYVVEFWATWCGPCVASMPHLAELQRAYADRGVTIVSVSDEPIETIESFLERPRTVLPGEESEGETFGDLTSTYCLTTDPDRSVFSDYMQSAAQRGLPTAFIVGKTGHIEWIGHPMTLDDPLDQVVSGAWNREAFAELFVIAQRIDMMMRDARRAIAGGDYAEARRLAERMVAGAGSPETRARAASEERRVESMIFDHMLQEAPSQAVEAFPALVDRMEGNPTQINRLAWGIYLRAAQGREISEELIRLAAEATEGALDPDAPDANLLDTIAHCYHHLGELDKAIDYQQRAVELGPHESNPRMQAAFDEFLEQLMTESESALDTPVEPSAESSEPPV